MKNAKVKLIIFVSVPVLIVSSIVMILYYISNADTYENIKIFEINGEVYIERKNNEKIKPHENMNLADGDKLVATGNSNAKLKLDDDKYVQIEPNSVLTVSIIVNSGTIKYKLNLEAGAVITEIQNKLDKNTTYDVCTPNSTMSVRGTVFRVAYSENSTTNLQVYEGKVEMNLNNSENSTIMIEKGKQAQAVGLNSNTKYEFTDKNADISILPDISLKFLEKIIDNGRDLSVSKEDIENLLNKTTTTISNSKTETAKDTLYNATDTSSEFVSDISTDQQPKTTTSQPSSADSNPPDTQIAVTEPPLTAPPLTTTSPKPTTVAEVVTTAAATIPSVTTSEQKVHVHFIFNGQDTLIQVNTGSTINPPLIISTIEGWYTDTDYTSKWDFSSAVKSEMYLYAKVV